MTIATISPAQQLRHDLDQKASQVERLKRTLTDSERERGTLQSLVNCITCALLDDADPDRSPAHLLDVLNAVNHIVAAARRDPEPTSAMREALAELEQARTPKPAAIAQAVANETLAVKVMAAT